MPNENTSRQNRRRRRNRRSHKRKRGLGKKIWLSLCAAFILVLVGGGVTVAFMIYDAPSLEASDLTTPQSTRIYDQDDKLVSTLFHEENRVNIDIENVPKTVQDAVISIEDKRFYDHHGVDIRRLFGAIVSNIKNGWGSEGGSTITQQVIKRTVLSPEKTLTRKVQEAWLALKLERRYSKEQILEMYLNNVYFGSGAYGIKTASETYFDEKDLSKLNTSQVALLAGLPNLPSAANPFEHPERAEERRDQVLSAMVDNGAISEQQANEAKEKSISDIISEEGNEDKNSDPYDAYVDTVYDQLVNQKQVVSEKEFFQGGLKIYTTLDSEAQEIVEDSLHSEDFPYPDENFETGVALVDTKTGEIKAIGGGRNFESIGDYNYGSSVQNDPGSTIKPVLDYGPAIEYLNWPTSHTLNDEPYQYSNGTPINEWDNQYWGDVTLRRALEWSRNIPALKAFQAVGKDKAQKFASGLGIHVDPIYESAAIGGFEGTSPLQMATAYAAFGNGGIYNEPFTVTKITFPDGKEWEPETESHEAMHDYTAYMITDMLKTVVTSGTGTQANISGLPVAGKTGSTNLSQEDKQKYGIVADGLNDSWFAGYTPEYSLAIWTGYPSIKSDDGDIQYIRGDGTDDIAKQLFRYLMSEISSPNVQDFTKPDSVVSIGSELYIRGTQPPPDEQEEQSDEDDADGEEKDSEEDSEEDDDEDEDEEEDDSEQDEEQNEENDDEEDGEQSDAESEQENDHDNAEQGDDQHKEKQQNQDADDSDGANSEGTGEDNQDGNEQENQANEENNDNDDESNEDEQDNDDN